MILHARTFAQFDDIIHTNPDIVVMFSRTLCGACVEMKPIFTKVANRPDMKHIVFVIVHAKFDKDDIEYEGKLGIEGWPTLCVVHKARPVEIHLGGMGQRKLIAWVNEHIRTA